MAFSDKELYRQAIELYNQGNQAGANNAMRHLHATTSNPTVKLMAIMGLVVPVNHGDPDKTLALCNEGLELATLQEKHGETAYLKSIKAYALTIKAGPMAGRMSELQLPPGWFGFSLETEASEYRLLQKQVDALLKGAKRLMSAATELARKNADNGFLAHTLMFKGEMLGQEFIVLQFQLLGSIRFKKLFRFVQINPIVFQSKEHRGEIRNNLAQTKNAFLESAKLFEALSDSANAGYALYNLANRLRSPMATKYLKKALLLASKANDKVLVAQCKGLAKEIPGYTILKLVS